MREPTTPALAAALGSRVAPAFATPAMLAAARAHAIAEHPAEAVGAIVAGPDYRPLKNVSATPTTHFRVAPRDMRRVEALAILHSHTNGRVMPSSADMAQQIATALPWGLIVTNGTGAVGPFWWGDMLAAAPLIGRTFRHGITDCYALIRDWYALERNVALPEFARDDGWSAAGGDLYRRHFAEAGFAELPGDAEPMAGDVPLMRLHGPVEHHAGILLGQGLVLHHLADRLSRREPFGPWRRYATTILRRTI